MDDADVRVGDMMKPTVFNYQDYVKLKEKVDSIVYCKDCKWYESDGGALMVCALTELVADDNDYCSWGERIEL